MSNDSNAREAFDLIDHVRLRPGMYVGGTDKRALHILIDKIIDERTRKSSLDIVIKCGSPYSQRIKSRFGTMAQVYLWRSLNRLSSRYSKSS
jgi:hypothetical protein